MSRPMRHKWGRRVDPLMNGALLSEEAIHRLLVPLHVAADLLPLGLFTKDHAESVAKLVNLVAADAASKGNGMWHVADAIGEVLLAMKARADAGKAWNCTAGERAALLENIVKIDRYMRTWTNKRFTIAAVKVDRINAAAKARGGQFLERVEIPTKGGA